MVVAALRRVAQQQGADSAELVDRAGASVDESGRRTWIALEDRPGLNLVLDFGAAVHLSQASAGDAAAQVSLALDYAALLQSERLGRNAAEAAVARLGRLQSLTAALAGALTAESIVTTVVKYGLETFQAIGGAIWVADERGDGLRLVGATDYPEAILTRWQHMPMDSPYPTAAAARERRTVLIGSLEQRNVEFPALRSEPSIGAGFAAVPLIVQDRLLGAFAASFGSSEIIFDPVNLAFIEAVAGQCAVALHRVGVLADERLAREQEAEAVRRLGRLQAVTARLSQPLSPDGVSDALAEELRGELATEQGLLFLLSADGKMLEMVGSLRDDLVRAGVTSSYPAVDFSLPGAEAVLTRKPVFLPSTTERNERYPALIGMPPFVELALACFPLLVEDTVIGLLSVSLPRVGEPSEEDKFFLQALADQTAQALDRNRLRADQQRSRSQLALLAETGRLFASSLDLDATLEQVCRLLVPALADASVARVLEPGGRIRSVAISIDDESALGENREAADDWLGDNAAAVSAQLRAIIDEGQTRIVRVPRSLGEHFGPGAGDLANLGLSSAALLPLRARGRSLGLITATTSAARAPMADADIPFLSELASRVALAVDNARLFHHQTEIAHTLQRSLLPAELPAIPGAEVAVTYLPGTEGTTVGGDFYDVIPLPSGRFGLVIGDVMGRGVRAAAAMGQLRAAIRAYALEGHSPADLLARLDRLVATLEDGLLVTCVYAEWDPGRCLIRLATAGHPPPVVRLPGGEPYFLDLDPGMPLGVGNIDCVDLELELPQGSWVLAYTDGLVESPELALGDGMESLRRAVADAGPSATALCRSAVDSLRVLQQPEGSAEGRRPPSGRRRHDDDIALLAIVVTGSDGSTSTSTLAGPGSGTASEVELPALPASAARSRQFVTDVLGSWAMAEVRDGDLLETAVLLVSELVTNAVRHAGTALRLRVLQPVAGRLRIEVIDHAPHGTLDSRLSGEAAEGGRGLFLVETLADAWGSAAIAGGKTIWFELDGDA